MTTLSTADDSSMEALEALLTFRHSITTSASSPSVHPEIPVPNPLNPLLPHVIEGDAVPANHTTARFSPRILKMSMPSHLPASSRVPSVPNPLDLLASGSAAKRSIAHMYSMQHQTTGSSNQLPFSRTTADDTLDPRDNTTKPPVMGTPNVHAAVRTEKIQAALNSMPQRGKKRRNLNDEERLELTRTRNREHAKCTRMKKKARHLELVEIEKMYQVLKAQQELNTSRKASLIKVIEGVSNAGERQGDKSCPHTCRLRNLLGEKLQHAQVSIFGDNPEDEVFTSAANSAAVKVSVSGTDYASGESKTMVAFCSVGFENTSSEISFISLDWISPKCNQSKMFPSISALSFETP